MRPVIAVAATAVSARSAVIIHPLSKQRGKVSSTELVRSVRRAESVVTLARRCVQRRWCCDEAPLHAVPSSFSPGVQPPPLTPTRPTPSHPSPPLNSFSQRVRMYLATHPASFSPSSSKCAAASTRTAASEEEEAWALDGLLELLVHSPDKASVSPSSPTAQPPQALLHPLLCVRILQRLGYAVWDGRQHPMAEATPATAGLPSSAGWSVRRHYPALTRRSTTLPSSSSLHQLPYSTTSPISIHLHENLQRVTTTVLGPLLPLLGDGTPAHPVTPPLRPVIPMVIEWLAALPTSEVTLPLHRWLPWVVAVYTAKLNNAERSTTPFVLLPPLRELLPHLIQKLRPHLDGTRSSEDEAAAFAWGDPTSVGTQPELAQGTLCERCLAALFTASLAEDGARPTKSFGSQGVDGMLVPPPRGDHNGAGEVNPTAAAADDDGSEAQGTSTLAQVVWWAGALPLLRSVGVRRAIHAVAPTAPTTAFSFLSLPIHPVAHLTGAGTAGKAEEPAALRAEVHEQRRRQPSPQTQWRRLPRVTVMIADDDGFRRVILRLVALQQRCAQAASSTCGLGSPVLVHLHISAALKGQSPVAAEPPPYGKKERLASASGSRSPPLLPPGRDPDVILCFIQPLHDYVLLLQEQSVATAVAKEEEECCEGPARREVSLPFHCPVQLSFDGVVNVLTAVFDRLEHLKQQSGCREAAAAPAAHRSQSAQQHAERFDTTYALLPQKARLHTLKVLCETLLRHVRAVQAAKPSDGIAFGALASAPPYTTTHLPWFAEVDLRVQEAQLRRFCGAARALVRVVMEERRCSLEVEGPEGSVLTASSVAAAHQHYTETGTAAPPAAFLPIATFDRTLRSLAFRVVEPALFAFYERCAEACLSAPLRLLSFAEWRVYMSMPDDGAATGSQMERMYRPLMEALLTVFDSVGGSAGLQTARQVLRHPSQQSLSALVEGIRLTALHCQLFDGVRVAANASPTPKELADEGEPMRCYMDWVLSQTFDAFFHVWQRTAPGSQMLGRDGRSTSAMASAVTRKGGEAKVAGTLEIEDAQLRLRGRLGLLCVVLHVEVLCARTVLHHRMAKVGDGVDALTALTEGTPSSILSLLQCLSEAHRSPAPFAVESFAAGAETPATDDSGEQLEEIHLWSLVLSGAVQRACVMPPSPVGCSSKWELIEELQRLSYATAGAGAPTTWQWLGSEGALGEAIDAAQRTTVGAAHDALYLLPWTTAALLHQPLRVYDESGQSRRAAREWEERMLRVWLMSPSPPAEGGGVSTAAAAAVAPDDTSPHQRRPLVRLVSVEEEIHFFAALRQRSSLALCPDLHIVRLDYRAEERVLPAVRRAIASAKMVLANASSIDTEEGGGGGWYAEEDCDGLD